MWQTFDKDGSERMSTDRSIVNEWRQGEAKGREAWAGAEGDVQDGEVSA